jgi:hypothetical protein
MSYAIDIYINLSAPPRNSLVQGFSALSQPSPPEFILRDDAQIRLHFMTVASGNNFGVTYDLGGSTTLRFGAKNASSFVSESGFLFYTDTFTRDADTDPTDITFTAPLSLNTSEFIAAFQGTNSTISLQIEVETGSSGAKRTVMQGLATGVFDVIRGNEGSPTITQPPSYYTIAQVDTLLSNKQSSDSDLTALAALTTTGILRRTGSGTASAGTAVAITEGGTGATTASAAVTALGAASATQWKTGSGNPNTLSISGTYGMVYQDTSNGQLYCYGETVLGNKWGLVVLDQGLSTSVPSQIFTNIDGYKQWANGITNDNGSVIEWGQFDGVRIRTGNGTDTYIVADFDQHTLQYGEVIQYDWGTNIVYDNFVGSYGQPSIKFNERSLIMDNSDGDVVYNWQDNIIYDPNSGSTMVSADFQNRYLGASDGTTLLEWGNQLKIFTNSSHRPILSNTGYAVQSAEVSAFSSQNITLVSATTFTVNSTAGNHIMIVVENSSTVADARISLVSLLNNMPSEGIIYLFSPVTLSTLALTIPSAYGSIIGASIGSLAANGTHVLRKIGTKLYHV